MTRVETSRGMAWVDLGPAGLGMLDLGKQTPVEGAAIRVQIARDAQGGKRHGLRQRLEIASAALIHLPGGAEIEIPRALSPAQRKSLRARLEAAAIPGEGWLARSAAAALTAEEITAEMHRLRASFSGGPVAPIRRAWSPASPIAERLRRWLTPGVEILCDDGALLTELRAAGLEQTTRRLPGGAALLAEQADALTEALANSVDLPQGARLHIEATRALTAIDVDLGGAALAEGGLAAATEIGRQIRLRALAGLIVIDLPRQRGDRERDAMAATLAKALDPCDPPARILGFTKGGLLEVTRARDNAPWTTVVGGLDAFLTPADRAP